MSTIVCNIGIVICTVVCLGFSFPVNEWLGLQVLQNMMPAFIRPATSPTDHVMVLPATSHSSTDHGVICDLRKETSNQTPGSGDNTTYIATSTSSSDKSLSTGLSSRLGWPTSWYPSSFWPLWVRLVATWVKEFMLCGADFLHYLNQVAPRSVPMFASVRQCLPMSRLSPAVGFRLTFCAMVRND